MNKTTFRDAAPLVVEHYSTHLAVAKVLGYDDLRNVSAWVNGLRPFPPQHCVTLEADSGSRITRQMLRPEDFGNYWPELIKQTATEFGA
jgi:DNA-binding transcriptional regulator YdaS (Cro superfamily)